MRPSNELDVSKIVPEEPTRGRRLDLFYGVMFALMFSQFWYKLTHGLLR